MARVDARTLEAALTDYGVEHEQLESKIAEIRRELRGRTHHDSVSSDGATPRRKMSAKGRANILAALRKRWAAFHAKNGQGQTVPAKPKRKLSAAARRKLVANLVKARAARAAKRAAG